MSEKIEIYNAMAQPTGDLIERSQMKTDGTWHMTRHVHFVNSKKGTITFQHRSPAKSVCGGLLDTAAAGHYAPGETASEALREVEEELGVFIKHKRGTIIELTGPRIPQPKEAKMIHMPYPSIRVLEMPSKNIKSHGFATVSFVDSELEPQHYTLQQSEVLGIAEFDTNEVRALMRKERDAIRHIMGVRFNDSGKMEPFDRKWTRDDFWPSPDNYYGKASSIAQRIAAGETVFDGL